jgi:two-component system cell cycle response regulator DivK
MPNILVVEDDPMNCDMLARHLKWEGYQVTTAANGVQAVALAHSEHIDLILMDMGLPVMNGWQATHRLKGAPETRAIPIIALTAYAMTEDRAKCFNVGCDEYESKPIDFPRLLAKMHQFLARAPKAGIEEDTTR